MKVCVCTMLSVKVCSAVYLSMEVYCLENHAARRTYFRTGFCLWGILRTPNQHISLWKWDNLSAKFQNFEMDDLDGLKNIYLRLTCPPKLAKYPNQRFSNQPKYGANGKKHDITIDNRNVIKKTFTLFLFLFTDEFLA